MHGLTWNFGKKKRLVMAEGVKIYGRKIADVKHDTTKNSEKSLTPL